MGCKKISIWAQEKPTLKVVYGAPFWAKKRGAGHYRFGFNGKEKDTDGEWGTQTHYDYGFRIYELGIGRFLSVDPLSSCYAELTPYQFASNTPIAAIDLDGLEFSLATNSDGHVYVNAHFKVLNSSNLSDENIKILMGDLKTKYLELMDRKYAGRQFKGWITFEYVDKVKPTDYFIEVVEPTDKRLKLGKGKANGKVNSIGGQNLVFSTLGLKNSDFATGFAKISTMYNEGSDFSDGVLHEIGHLFGLLHPWDKKGGGFRQISSIRDSYLSAAKDPMSDAGQELSANLMNSPGNPNMILGVNFSKKKLTQDQFGQMYRNLYNKKIGQKQTENYEKKN